MPRVSKRPAARRDLVEHYVHLAESAGEETAAVGRGGAEGVLGRDLGGGDVGLRGLAEQHVGSPSGSIA